MECSGCRNYGNSIRKFKKKKSIKKLKYLTGAWYLFEYCVACLIARM